MEVLAEAEAQDCASHFARHRITWEMLKTMTDEELKEVSVETCSLTRNAINLSVNFPTIFQW